MNSAYPVDDRILRSLWSSKNPLPVSPKDFENIGKPSSIRQAMARLVKAGKLRRIRRGLYERPRVHPIIGQTPSDPLAVVESIMLERSAPWQVSGAYAANLLGLSEQVPAQLVINTTAQVSPISLGNIQIRFRRVAPSSLVGGRRQTGLVIQAVRHLGPNGVTQQSINRLQRQLKPATKRELQKLVLQVPRWMKPVIQQLAASGPTPAIP